MGGFISLTNPKTMLFFAAFLPQFVNPLLPPIAQIATLSLIFLFLAAVIDSLYAIMADKLVMMTKKSNFRKGRNLFAGILYIVVGIGLATTKRA